MSKRLIKFRAKDPSDNKWRYSHDLHDFFYAIDDGQLDSETLCQFTGLKDKNGKEIYEGDIIKFMGKWDENGNVLPPDYLPYKVIWFMGGFRAHLIQRPHGRSFHRHNEMLGVGHTNNEIIGNIFENPSLLLNK